MKFIKLRPLNILLLFVTFTSSALAQDPGGDPEKTPPSAEQAEVDFLNRINQFRKSIGASELKREAKLDLAARKHSEWMNAQSTLSHTGENGTSSSDRIRNEGYRAKGTAENIACGNPDAEKTFRQWRNSRSHLSVMMSRRYTEIGIARAGNGTQKCRYYWTTDFGTPLQNLEDEPLENEDED